MSPQTRTLLEAFAKEVQWKSAGSPADQERMLDFIVGAYKNGDHTIDQDEFIDIVNEFDADRLTADPALKKRAITFKLYTYQKYEEGIKLLKRFDK